MKIQLESYWAEALTYPDIYRQYKCVNEKQQMKTMFFSMSLQETDTRKDESIAPKAYICNFYDETINKYTLSYSSTRNLAKLHVRLQTINYNLRALQNMKNAWNSRTETFITVYE